MPIWSSSLRQAGRPGRPVHWLACLAALAAQGPRSPAEAQDAPPRPLLGYCAPPFVPPCADRLKDHPEALDACTPEMDRYIASVFTYRACLTRETERAIRQSNEAIAKFRCAQKRGPC